MFSGSGWMSITCELQLLNGSTDLLGVGGEIFKIFLGGHYVIIMISGGSRGRRRRAPPLRVQILSFWHTNFSKRSRLGSWRPPTRSAPPYRKSWIRYWWWYFSCTRKDKREVYHWPPTLSWGPFQWIGGLSRFVGDIVSHNLLICRIFITLYKIVLNLKLLS